MPEVVTHYGAHNAEGIWFLEQTEGGSNALGLSIPSPFRVKPVRKTICNHNIPLYARPGESDVERFQLLASHPLVREMLPVPKRGPAVPFFVDEGWLTPALAALGRMSSPTHGIVRPLWTEHIGVWLKELETTNCQPLVLTGVEPRNTSTIHRLAQASTTLPRRLILAGSSTVGVVPNLIEKAVPAPLDVSQLEDLPLDKLGGWYLSHWMRGIDAARVPSP